MGTRKQTNHMYYPHSDTDFLLSPDASILRSLAESLYPAYLSRLYNEGKNLKPHPIPALDKDFTSSSEALWFRVLCETVYTQTLLTTQKIKHTVLWFGSARLNTERFKAKLDMPDYYSQAEELSEMVTRWSLSIGSEEVPQPFMICTGGGPGIMEAGNRGAQNAGGRSMGLNITLPTEQDGNPFISEGCQSNFQYFFTRKFYFLRRAKAAVIFPGGYGTFDELFETLTLIQTGKMSPFKIILFGTEYWKNVVNMEKLVDYGMIAEADLDLFEYQNNVHATFESLTNELKTSL